MFVKLFTSLFFTFFIYSFTFSQTTLKGTIKDKKGTPIPYATIFLKNSRKGAISSDNGEFTLISKFKGVDTISVTAVGFDSYKKTIQIEGIDITLDIQLKSPVVTYDEVVITAGMIEASNERSVAVLKPLDIVTTAGGQGDIVGAIQTLPGVQRNGGDQTGLMVRGGDVNESVMIIDGMIAQNAFQSSVPGVSQRSRFNPFQFKGTSFSSGGYTARYGQALSAVLDLQTNDLPEKNNVNVGLNMAGLSLSGSKLMGNNAIEYAVNYQNLQPFYGITPTNVNFYKVPQGGSFSTRYISKLDSSKGIFKMNFSRSFSKSGIEIPNPLVAGAKINYSLENENTYFNTSFRYFSNANTRYFTAFSYSSNSDKIGFGSLPFNRNDSRAQGRAEMWHSYHPAFNLLSGIEIQRIGYDQKFDTISGAYVETLGAFYLEGEIKSGKRFAIKPGVRGEYSQLLKQGNIVPRLAFAYKLTQYGQLSFAGGMFAQSAGDSYLMQGYKPNFQLSTHYMLNYQWMNKNRVLRLEGYYKDYKQLIKENGTAFIPTQFRFNFGMVDNSGSGYAKGIDLFWRDKESVKNLDYWISYSYVDTKRIYQNYISKVTPDYVSPHNLNIIVKYMIEKIQTNFSFSYNYASGRPYYNPSSSEFLSDRTKSYQNVALTASYLRTFKKKVFAVFYVSLDNILNTKNVLGYRYASDGSKYPILPPLYRAVFVGMNFSFSQFNQDEL
jgi:hypothetical protein